MVSQGSAASSLAIPNHTIFRYWSSDGVKGAAISNTMYTSGKRMVITLACNDAGNIGLQNSVGSVFSSLGGQTDAITPYATNLSNYSSLLAGLKARILQYNTNMGANEVAGCLASFDECVDIFRQVSADPVFSTVKWYGGDGVVQSAALLADTTAYGRVLQKEIGINTIF